MRLASDRGDSATRQGCAGLAYFCLLEPLLPVLRRPQHASPSCSTRHRLFARQPCVSRRSAVRCWRCDPRLRGQRHRVSAAHPVPLLASRRRLLLHRLRCGSAHATDSTLQRNESGMPHQLLPVQCLPGLSIAACAPRHSLLQGRVHPRQRRALHPRRHRLLATRQRRQRKPIIRRRRSAPKQFQLCFACVRVLHGPVQSVFLPAG